MWLFVLPQSMSEYTTVWWKNYSLKWVFTNFPPSEELYVAQNLEIFISDEMLASTNEKKTIICTRSVIGVQFSTFNCQNYKSTS